MMLRLRSLGVWCVAVGLAACGGGGSTSSTVAPVGRGSLLTSPPAKVASFSVAESLTLLGGSDPGRLLLQIGGAPLCDVDVHQLKYETVDPAAALTPASGVLMVPSGSNPPCQGARPITSATTVRRSGFTRI